MAEMPKLAPKAAKKAAPKPKAGASGQPVLLSGGNPQIAKGYGEAPIQAYIAAMPGWKSGLGTRLDALISAAVPGVRKAVKWNSPLYGADEQSFFLGLHCFAKYVKICLLPRRRARPAAARPLQAEGGALSRYLRARRPRRGPVHRLGKAGSRPAGREDVSGRQSRIGTGARTVT